MRLIRENNIVADFKYVRKKPSQLEIHRWIKNTFNFSQDQINGIQCNTLSKKVYIKLISDKLVKETLKKFENESPRFVDDQGEVFSVPLDEEGQDVLLKIYDLPMELEDYKIKDFLSSYGLVKGVRREKFTGVDFYEVENGIRSVLIVMKKAVPSYVTIDGYTSLVVYRNQIRTCMYCNNPGHEKRECPHRPTPRMEGIRRPSAPLPNQQDEEQRRLYADAVNNKNMIQTTEEKIADEADNISTQTDGNIAQTTPSTQALREYSLEITPKQTDNGMAAKKKNDVEKKGKTKRGRELTTTSSEEEAIKPLKTKLRRDTNGLYYSLEPSPSLENRSDSEDSMPGKTDTEMDENPTSH